MSLKGRKFPGSPRSSSQGKAAYAEMDILLTKDHQFVVMHDYNLKHLAGVDKGCERYDPS